MSDPQSLAEAAGGMPGLRRLAEAWHRRVMADEVVSHAFHGEVRPDHVERLAAYWCEALGGGPEWTSRFGDESAVVRRHSGNGPHPEMDDRAIACFADALVEVDITGSTAEALTAYFAWVTRVSLTRYEGSPDDVPDGLELPRWGFSGLIDQGRSS